MWNNLVQVFFNNAEKHPAKFCLGWGSERLTYAGLAQRVRAAAVRLQRELGVKPGDFVMISAVARSDYVIVYLAAQMLGAVTIPIDRLIKAKTLSDLVAYVKPKILLIDQSEPVEGVETWSLKELVTNSGSPVAETELPTLEQDLQRVSEMLFTTGTTGCPKGAMLSYESVRAITENTRLGVGMRSDDIVLIPLPLNHSVGMRVLRAALSIGAGVVIQDGFTFAHELEDNIVSFGCTVLVGVPTSIEVVRRQMQSKFAEVLGKLRYIELGAGSLSVPMKRTLVAELPNTQIYNTWGSSETGGVIFLDVRNAPEKLSSLGKPVEGVEFGVLRDDGEIRADAHSPETAGRMALRGKMHMMGYFGRPEESADAVRGDWLVTNDLAYRDADGFVYMLGRADDVINVGGEKVAPIEIENVAQEYPQMRECAVVAASDKLMGQVPALFYVLDSGSLDQEKFLSFMSARVERYKLPQRFIELTELPRNRMQKLDRKALKAMLATKDGEKGAAVKSLDNETIRTILTRKSIRVFEDREVPRELLEKIVQCGIQAPTGHNMQTWRFTVITKRDAIGRIKELLQRKAKEYKAVCYGFNDPPVAILMTNDMRNKNGAQDCACAAENMMLAAHSLGLGAVWQNTISYMQDDPEMRLVLDELNVPKRHWPWLLLLLGHPADGQAQSPKRRMDVVEWV